MIAPPTQGPRTVRSSPSVTVALVNHNSRDDVLTCIDSVLEQDYPSTQVEIIVVDNASTDGSVEAIRSTFPTVQVIANDDNVGFAPAINQAARAGRGEMLALINNDAVAEPDWLRELIAPMVDNARIRCTGGLVVEPDGTTIQFGGGRLTFYGHGIEAHEGEQVTDRLHAEPSIFVTGASLATPRAFYLDIGGFDDDFFAFFEDVDYGWRVWVLGYETWFIPAARIRHKAHGTISRAGNARWRYLLERNALFTIFKNHGDDLLASTLPSSLLMTLLRGFEKDDPSTLGDYRIGRDANAGEDPEPSLSPLVGAHLAALRDFGLHLDVLRDKRREVQDRRRRPDTEILPLFREAVRPNGRDSNFWSIWTNTVNTFELPWGLEGHQRILIVTTDTIGERMAGPAIRVWEMATLLSEEHDVRVVSMRRPERDHPDFQVGRITAANARMQAWRADVIITQGGALHHFPELADADAHLVVDLYDPFHIEVLVHQADQDPADRWHASEAFRALVNDQVMKADLVLCASERQRTFWLGQLAASGRINPATYDDEPGLRHLLRVVPFGLPSDPPRQQRSALRQDGPAGITPDDIVLLWGGGIYEWFDPVTLLRALSLAVRHEPRLKLYFLGGGHPNPDVPEMPRAAQARRVAEELGLLDRHVFFNDDWVPYEQRADWLLDADVGVSTHFPHLETELSFRTRLLDYLWTGLPIVATEGDALADLVVANDLGEVVPAEDDEALSAALLRLADADRRAEVRRNIEAFAPQWTWATTLQPLIEWCRNPRPAPDHTDEPSRYIRQGASLFRRSPAQLAKTFVFWAQDKGLSSAVRAGFNSVRVRRESRKVAEERVPLSRRSS